MNLPDIQRRRSRRTMASRPDAIPQSSGLGQIEPATAGDVKAQSVRLADVFVFGPMMIYSGLGKDAPGWLKAGMIIIGAGTIIYNLVNYFEVEKRKAAGTEPQGMAGIGYDLRRQIALTQRLAP